MNPLNHTLLLLLAFLPVTAFAQRGPLDTLSGTVVQELRFENATVEDVISHLVRLSREQDPRGIGVNMIYLAPDAGQNARPLPTVSLDLRGVTLLQVLDLVVDRAGLGYHVERNIIRVERAGRARMETRFYPVDPTMFTQRVGAMQRR